MNGRSGWVMFVLFVLLGIMILLQILSMIQNKRLQERLEAFVNNLESIQTISQIDSN